MAKIFISYRRDDSQYQADKLHAALKLYVANPKEDIFIDVDNIPLGVDFADHLDGRVAECEVLLALIGKGWSAARDPATGQRRLDDPADFVRVEIAAALKRGIPVVPVLLDGAQIPGAADLPDDLKPLARRNGLPVTRASFDSDIVRLVRGLPINLGDVRSEPAATEEASPAAVPFDPKRYVFVSYHNTADPLIVRSVVRELIKAGLPVWLYDPVPFKFELEELKSIRWQRAGAAVKREAHAALQQSACVVALIGKLSVDSRFQRREIDLASKLGKLVALRIDEVALESLPKSVRNTHAPALLATDIETGVGIKVLMMLSSDVKRIAADAQSKPPPPWYWQDRRLRWGLVAGIIALAVGLAMSNPFGWFGEKADASRTEENNDASAGNAEPNKAPASSKTNPSPFPKSEQRGGAAPTEVFAASDDRSSIEASEAPIVAAEPGSGEDFEQWHGDGRVYFSLDSYSLDAASQQKLDEFSYWFEKYPAVRIIVGGHAANEGPSGETSREYALGVGERRASAVRDYLISRGIAASRIDTVSYGKERPLDQGSDATANARNRHAQVVPLIAGQE